MIMVDFCWHPRHKRETSQREQKRLGTYIHASKSIVTMLTNVITFKTSIKCTNSNALDIGYQ